ncbi:MAG: hypothetical protein WD468_01030 [Pirellulales bacterium]
MSIESPSLSDEQRQALEAAGDRGPVKVVDPVTNRTYILVRANLYERFKALFTEDEFTVAQAYTAMDDVARQEGWVDPEMDVYDRLDPRRAPRQSHLA